MQRNIDENDLSILSSIPLFKGIYPTYELLESILSKKETFAKGSILVHEGIDLNNLGIILKGSAIAYKIDPFGKKLIISNLCANYVFGGILSVNPAKKSPVSVQATSELTVIFIPTNAIMDGLGACYDPKNILLRNLLNIISDKFFELHERINCIIRPSLREKILFYLNNCAKEAENREFTIPFNRQALAEYLNADRSALSRELSRMKAEGEIDFSGKTFRIKKILPDDY